ncbi:MAG: response regulator [Patescibacteria group bacterium]|jgi:DNA-binding response OmpR family regulator
MVAKKRILIAEDEKSMANALELKLNKSGFEAKAVYDGEQALATVTEGGYDLMLLDLMMPKLDGFGVLEGIKKKNLKIKVIITSNLSQEEDIKKAKDLGAIDYIVKSDTPIQAIVEKIKSL